MSSEQKICFCGYQALDEELMEMHIDYSNKDIVNQTVQQKQIKTNENKKFQKKLQNQKKQIKITQKDPQILQKNKKQKGFAKFVIKFKVVLHIYQSTDTDQ